MSNMLIAIDGACRRNGKSDCVASGGVFVMDDADMWHNTQCNTYEYGSTNQRGELLALQEALERLAVWHSSAQIITDSEYLFNAMTKEWPERWDATGWRTVTGEEVKNSDIWKRILVAKSNLQEEVVYYHIKGHAISFGKATAKKLLSEGVHVLYNGVSAKFEEVKASKADTFEKVQELSKRNNGFRLPDDIFKKFIVANTMADIIATTIVEKADT